MMRRELVGLILGTVFLVAGHARADMYRRVDKQGVVHFTNIRPRTAGWHRVIRSTKPTRQYKSITPYRVVNDPPLATSTNWEAHIQEAAALYKIPDALIRAVMRVESGFHPNVVSQVGAMGLMQLMPGTAARMGVKNPFDPRQNILGGTRYLRVLANLFRGNLIYTLAGYNAGENAVLKYGGIPPYDETQRYVRRVLQHYQTFKTLPKKT